MSKKEKTIAEIYKSVFMEGSSWDIALIDDVNPNYSENEIHNSVDIKRLERAFKILNGIFFANKLTMPYIDFNSKMRAEVKFEMNKHEASSEDVKNEAKDGEKDYAILLSDKFLGESTLAIYTALMQGMMIYADEMIVKSKEGRGEKKGKKLGLFSNDGIYINKDGIAICKEYGIRVEEGVYFGEKQQNSENEKRSRRYHFVAETNGIFYKELNGSGLLADKFVGKPRVRDDENNKNKLFRMECPICNMSIYVSKGNCEKDIRCFNEGCNGTRFEIKNKK